MDWPPNLLKIIPERRLISQSSLIRQQRWTVSGSDLQKIRATNKCCSRDVIHSLISSLALTTATVQPGTSQERQL